MESLNVTSTGVLDEQAPSPIENPKIILLPWMIGTVADNLLQGGYPFSRRQPRLGGIKSLKKTPQSGIVTIQLLHYFSYFNSSRCSGFSARPRDIFVFVLGVLSFAKSGQCVAIVWEQNITYKLDPEKVYEMSLHNYLELLTPFTVRIQSGLASPLLKGC